MAMGDWDKFVHVPIFGQGGEAESVGVEMGDDGPDLEDFLASDPGDLPFLDESYGRTRAAAGEDAVEYRIFLDGSKAVSDLRQWRDKLLAWAEAKTKGYIWQNGQFALSVVLPPAPVSAAQEATLEPHLYGCVPFGENLEDEWLVTYLLKSMTEEFTEVTACATDGDGQFMLIEAAAVLPPFFSPSTSANRVWLRGGRLHLVMPGVKVDGATNPRYLGSGEITQQDGVKAVREGYSRGSTLAPEAAQAVMDRKLGGYPQKARDSMHFARCFVPPAVAKILLLHPAAVAKAVLAYAQRDPSETREGIRMAHLGGPAGTAGVEVRVKFTRHLYSQLRMCQATAGGRVWEPLEVSHLTPQLRSKASELGRKLSMGMEMAYIQCRRCCARREEGGGVEEGAWESFLARLKAHGYFEGELEGSLKYREKLAQAKQHLRDRTFAAAGGEEVGEGAACSLHELADKIMEGSVLKSHVFGAVPEEDDSDSFMEVSQQELEAMLLRHAQDVWEAPLGGSAPDSKGLPRDLGSAPASDPLVDMGDLAAGLDDIVEGFSTFLADDKAGLEGAEVPAVGSGINFDVEKFMSILRGDGPSPTGADDLAEFFDSSESDEESDEEPIAQIRVGTVGGRRIEEVLGQDSDDEVEEQQQQQQQQPGAAKAEANADPPSAADLEFMKEYMEAMTDELDEHTTKESFERFKREAADTLARSKKVGPISADEVEGERDSVASPRPPAVDVDANLVTQLLESFSHQQGAAGPASTLLREMGLAMPTGVTGKEGEGD
ncbi:unnamed protein product [Chrysoparadoxa australica]